MTDTGSWVGDYSSTFLHWLLVGAAVIGMVLLTYFVLRRLGVKAEAATGIALIMPWVLGFLIFNLFPFVTSFYLSFTDYNILRPISLDKLPPLVGLKNYINALTEDPNFWPGMKLTLLNGAIGIPLGLAGSLATAMLLARDVKGVGIWRTIYYLPAVLPAAATALLWRWMFNPSNGLINTLLSPILSLFGLAKPGWFTDANLVLPSYIIMGMWGVFGTTTVILLAGLKNVPRDLYEAATLDGAGGFGQFRNVTVPMLTPTLFYVFVTSMIGALQFFTAALFIQTPREAGTFLNVYIWQQAFGSQKMGYASALAWILLAITFALTALVFRSQSLWVYYESEVRQEKPQGTRKRGLLGGPRATETASGAEGSVQGGH
ncbi:MAG: sugar ABC transporter permease [Chloroflexota bacterium]